MSVIKSLATDFGGSVRLDQLHREISESENITTEFYGITLSEDVVTFQFESTPDSGELTELDSLISAHTPDYRKQRKIFFTVYPEDRNIRTTDYSTIATFEYLGSDLIGLIDYIDVITKVSSGSYNVRVVITDNSQILSEVKELDNKRYQTIDLGTLSNIPSDRSILEIQVSVNDRKSTAYLQQAIVYYNNSTG